MKKSLMALAAVATLAASMASPAYAHDGWGPGLAAGVLGGAIIGGAIASSPHPYGYYGPGPGYYYGPGYVDGGPYGPCYWQHQRFWNGYAWVGRNVRVCE